jgi:MSHA biogenesis protein MshO
MVNLPAAHRGFTLMELVIVIVILGIVSGIVGNIVSTGAKIYVDATERDQLLSESRFVVERLNRELRMAVPNSARVTGDADIQCLEFVQAEWVTFYTNLPTIPSTSKSAHVVEIGDITGNFSLDTSTDFAIVYPTVSTDIYDLTENKRKKIDACIDTGTDTSCNSNDDPNHLATLTVNGAFADDSPASRLYIASKAVSYCVQNNSIYRYVDAINNSQVTYDIDINTDGSLMAENLVNDLSSASELPFMVSNATLRRNSLVQILLTFEHNDEIVNFSNEVHIPNVP